MRSSYFQNLLESFSYGVVIFSANGEAYAANARAGEILGRPLDDIPGRGPAELFACMQGAEIFETYVPEARDAKASLDHVHASLACGDETRHLSLSASLLIENEKVFGILVSMQDVTDIFRLHEREKEILAEKHALEQERARDLEELASAMAHQIRNPIASIGGFSRMIRRKCDDRATLAEPVEAITESALRLERIIAAFGEYTAMGAGEVKRTDLDLAVSGALERAVRLAASRGIVLDASVDLDPVAAPADPELLDLVLDEVLVNCIDALEGDGGKGSVYVRLQERDGSAVMEIEDSGPGLGPEQLPYALNPFYSTKPDGVGMGLTKAARAAREMNGEFRLGNANPAGALATLVLPLAERA